MANLFLSQKLTILGILETKLTMQAFVKMKQARFPHLEAQHCTGGFNKSRMLILWNPQEVHLEIKEWQDQYSYTIVTCLASMKVIALTIVYG